jgi:putative membrane protein
MAMGAADVVPGVSGGTIAFISGIYEELLNTISSINFGTLKILRKEGIKAAWKSINGNFLVALFAGIGISIASLAWLVEHLLEHHPVLYFR